MNNTTNKVEISKQSKSYLSEIYSTKRRPITNYPLKLVKYLRKRYLDNGETKFASIPSLVEFYQLNKGILPCVLTYYPLL